MAQFRIQHPYDPGFALPPNVIAEPPGRGTLTTLPLPRRTFDDPVPGWDGGYGNQPSYVRAEPIGRGAAYTMPDMRRTIPLHVPSELGDDASDALRAYGYRAADAILSAVPELPRNQRALGLEALFHAIDPSLLARVTARMQAGQAPRDAVAKAMAEGFGREIMRLGRSGRPSSLGYYGGPQAMAGLWDSIKGAFSKVGSGIKTAGKTTYSWGGKVLTTVGGIACGVAGSSAGPAIGGGVAAGFGAPPQVGVAGTQVAANLCPKGQVPIGPPIAPPPMFPPWLLPVAIGGVGVVAVILLTKK